MPILVKDYTWIQSEKMVNVRVPITKDSYHENVDLFTTDSYIKANFSPYIFEAFLLHDVDIKRSRCLVKDEVIILDLRKREYVEWETLEKDLTKVEKTKIREEVINKSVEEAKQESEDRRIKRSQLDRFTVQRAMDIDAKLHELMDSRRENEKAKAMTALEEWRLSHEINPTPINQKSLPPFRSYTKDENADKNLKFVPKFTKPPITEVAELSSAEQMNPDVKKVEEPSASGDKSTVKEVITDDKANPVVKASELKPEPNEIVSKANEDSKSEETTKASEDKPESNKTVSKVTKELKSEVGVFKPSEDKKEPEKKGLMWRPPPKGPPEPIKTPVRSEYVEKKKKEVAKRVLPKLRQSGSVEITHTPRTFPTPSRESAHEEEQAWLKNITQARRATGFVSEDLRPEEQDPQWCKDKGDEFFRNGNFLGAISAYSHGITLSDKLPSLYSNRAAAHFALGNFNKCVQDCSTAIELMKPACEGNRRSRAKCIARRAAALARIGFLHKAILEMKVAAKLLPEDEKIKKDIKDMEHAWEQNPDDG